MSASPRSRSLRIARTARYYTKGDPASAREIWYLLHGYGQLASDFLASCAALEDPSRLLVAPEALSRLYLHGRYEQVGASWMTREERESEIGDYIHYLDAVHAEILSEVNGLPVSVLGFSQGAATASRWAALGRAGPERLICWGGDVAHDIPDPASALEGVALTLVHGTRDRLITRERQDALRDRLDAAGVPYEIRVFEGGHRMDAEMLASLTAAR